MIRTATAAGAALAIAALCAAPARAKGPLDRKVILKEDTALRTPFWGPVPIRKGPVEVWGFVPEREPPPTELDLNEGVLARATSFDGAVIPAGTRIQVSPPDPDDRSYLAQFLLRERVELCGIRFEKDHTLNLSSPDHTGARAALHAAGRRLLQGMLAVPTTVAGFSLAPGWITLDVVPAAKGPCGEVVLLEGTLAAPARLGVFELRRGDRFFPGDRSFPRPPPGTVGVALVDPPRQVQGLSIRSEPGAEHGGERAVLLHPGGRLREVSLAAETRIDGVTYRGPRGAEPSRLELHENGKVRRGDAVPGQEHQGFRLRGRVRFWPDGRLRHAEVDPEQVLRLLGRAADPPDPRTAEVVLDREGKLRAVFLPHLRPHGSTPGGTGWYTVSAAGHLTRLREDCANTWEWFLTRCADLGGAARPGEPD